MIFNKKDKESVIIDIGSASVGLVILKNSKGKRTLTYSKRIPIPFQESTDGKKYQIYLLKTLNILLKKTQSELNNKLPNDIFCFLSSVWHIPEIRNIKISKSNKFTFSKKTFDEAIEREIKMIKKSHSLENPSFEKNAYIIESEVVKIKLNGYSANNPYGKKCKEASIFSFFGISSKNLIDKIEDEIDKTLGKKRIKFYSYLFSFFYTVGRIFDQKNDFLLVDVGGEISDVSVVKNGIIRSTYSFPIGFHFITRRIMSSLAEDESQVISYTTLYFQGKLNKTKTDKIEKILSEAGREWLKSFSKSLESLSAGISIPSAVFLSTASLFEKFFVKLAKEEEFNQYTLTDRKFDIVPINSSILKQFFNLSSSIDNKNIQTTHDPFLMTEALFISDKIEKMI